MCIHLVVSLYPFPQTGGLGSTVLLIPGCERRCVLSNCAACRYQLEVLWPNRGFRDSLSQWVSLLEEGMPTRLHGRFKLKLMHSYTERTEKRGKDGESEEETGRDHSQRHDSLPCFAKLPYIAVRTTLCLVCRLLLALFLFPGMTIHEGTYLRQDQIPRPQVTRRTSPVI